MSRQFLGFSKNNVIKNKRSHKENKVGEEEKACL